MSNGNMGGETAEFINFLKTEARLLHKAFKEGDAVAARRLKRQCSSIALGAEVQRKHCLTTIGRELGFVSWQAARDCFLSDDASLFDTFLHPRRCHVHWNIWFADLSEARRVRSDHGGYLLVYKSQYMVVDRDYIASLGTDPDHPAWFAIGRDWTMPGKKELKTQLITQIANAHFKSIIESVGDIPATKLTA